ncbi:hypothetical protein DXG01_007648 [Tephrocybe rancida]|nr:hypothetical protein DXG01_007648 [Tephrocybe rancida]
MPFFSRFKASKPQYNPPTSAPPGWAPAPETSHQFGLQNEAPEEEFEAAEAFCAAHPVEPPHLLSTNIIERINAAGSRVWGLEPPRITRFIGNILNPEDSKSGDGCVQVATSQLCGDTCLMSNLPLVAGLYEIQGKYGVYYEVYIESMDTQSEGFIAIGTACRPYPEYRLPGWNRMSAGLHLDDMRKFFEDPCGGRDYLPPNTYIKVGPNDTVGCGYEFQTGALFFTYNDQRLPNAFSGIYLPRMQQDVYAAVGVSGGVNIKVNFGGEYFRWAEGNEWSWKVEGQVGGRLAPIAGDDIDELPPIYQLEGSSNSSTRTRAHCAFLSSTTLAGCIDMSPQSPAASEPPESFQSKVTAVLTFEIPVEPGTTTKKAKKGAASKPKTRKETKNKQFNFSFAPETENYAKFMNDILNSHGLLSKYGPASSTSRFRLRLQIPPANKSNAVDIEKFSEYASAITEAAKAPPVKLTAYVEVKDIKAAAKKRKAAGDGSDEDEGSDVQEISSDDEKVNNVTDDIDRELARLRGELEDRFQNKHDSGYTFLTDSGEPLPLTPLMMKEWARGLYDHSATFKMPPRDNEAFSLAYRQESLPAFPGGPRRSRQPSANSTDGLAHVSSIIGSLTNLITSPVLHAQSALTHAHSALAPAFPISPAQNTPTKLRRYLEHAESKLGVVDATCHLDVLDREGYGPDILDSVNDADLVALGLKPGDALRLKRGAASWWLSSNAKRPKTSVQLTLPPLQDKRSIRFEKRWVEGGSASYFGSAIVVGRNVLSAEYSWWYYSQEEGTLVKLPDGKVPLLDDECASARDGEDPDD